MADIPKFGYPRRIDIVDAVNELGGAVEAALAEGKCDAPKAYVDAQVAGVEARLEAFEADAKTVTVTEQLHPGTVSALAYGKTVCIEFGGVNVTENVKTKVGSVAAKYAPRASKTGTLVAAAGNDMISAYCKVETDGSIYINPVMTSGAGCTWVGTFTYLI